MQGEISGNKLVAVLMHVSNLKHAVVACVGSISNVDDSSKKLIRNIMSSV